MQALTGPAAVVAACDHHPLARFAVGILAAPTGFTDEGATLFVGGSREDRDTGFFLGNPDKLDDLLEQVRRAGQLDRLGWIHLARGYPVPDGFRTREQWDFLWATRAPAPVPRQETVLPLPATQSVHDELNALLDLAMPDSTVRPGDRSRPRWFGIRDGEALLACGADRSGRHPSPAPVGVVGGIAVHPAYRGRGYGAAISAAITANLFDRYDLVTLGVWADNTVANRIYEWIGYTNRYEITSVQLDAS